MLDKSQLSPTIKPLNQQAEIEKFDALAAEWRDPNGKFKHVLAFNQTRLTAIENAIAQHFKRDLNQDIPFQGLRILDIGCGVGLLCEPLASQGADVTGIDASAYNIRLAQQHANNWSIKVEYKHCLADDLLNTEQEYDVILNTEVIEHVEDKHQLIEICCDALAPGGLLVMATLNRTVKSYLIAIIGAEYVMGYLPKGTHEWQHFVKPQEISQQLNAKGLNTLSVEGVKFNPLINKWKITKETSVNYLLYAEKPT
ncbi:bifunctional 2-polyprenyl-6-hydroxyphenol methylase/3-demethylubiquinol 3-O-methyltransferase UbiG [Shewanella colwelliana]|uniref:bifunctional 2-polyprenyl-6-hydroxyphenol methylase/3-demethylubiquinol 3-O-methyltransferase UbiG n=1 Tax=Shewanella colwelliana TaxID=23 RepID=UPI000491A63C|nr:bifunctional 2-polyprenyl-6-hydroxyphenol methylase/3-demethylubiquinol 3-O-methyltransferase UbiG [Shewanella colwelliana]